MTTSDVPTSGNGEPESAGRPRASVTDLPAYKPGKAAAQAEEEHGIANAIKLASNEGPWGPLPSVLQLLSDSGAGINRYADSRATELRERIASWVSVDPSQVTVGCGSVGLIQQLFLAYIDPGDEVVFPWISFEVYPVFTQLMSGVAVKPALVDNAVDLDAVAAAVTERTKMVILANPNNPTGTAFSIGELETFMAKIPNQTLVVLDEAYREFMDPALGNPLDSLLGDNANMIVLRTFSKAQGLAALRVGYAVASADLISTLDRTALPFAVNGQAQVAAIASIDANDQIMERVQTIRGERDRMVGLLRSDGWNVPTPETNFVYLAIGERTSDVHLALEKAGLVTRPFPGVGLRITVGEVSENERVLDTLAPLSPGD